MILSVILCNTIVGQQQQQAEAETLTQREHKSEWAAKRQKSMKTSDKTIHSKTPATSWLVNNNVAISNIRSIFSISCMLSESPFIMIITSWPLFLLLLTASQSIMLIIPLSVAYSVDN